ECWLVEPEATIHRKQLVVFLDEVVSRSEYAKRILSTNVALETQNADVSIFIEELKVIGTQPFVANEVTWPVIAGHHQSKSIPTHLSGCFNRNVGIDDCPR